VPTQGVAADLNRGELDHEVARVRSRVDVPQGFDGEAGQINAHAGGRGKKLLRPVNGGPAGLVAQLGWDDPCWCFVQPFALVPTVIPT